MYRQAMKDLRGDALAARDGEIGSVKDLCFDDASWTLRYFVVDTGRWLPGRKVLIPPQAVSRERREDGALPVELTRDEVENSPSADAEERSASEVIGYRIEAADGWIGHVEDFVIDDEGWAIAGMVVDTRNWLPGGQKVILPPTAIQEIDWRKQTVHVRFTKDELRKAPAV